MQNAYLKSSAASSAVGFVAVGTRLPPSDVPEVADVGGWVPSMSLLTRSWIPVSWGFASNTAPIWNIS